jgi:hypothetical protein
LNCIGGIKFNICNSFIAAASGISNDSDVSDFTTAGFAEEIPDITLFSFERQAIYKDGVIFPLSRLHLFFYISKN